MMCVHEHVGLTAVECMRQLLLYTSTQKRNRRFLPTHSNHNDFKLMSRLAITNLMTSRFCPSLKREAPAFALYSPFEHHSPPFRLPTSLRTQKFQKRRVSKTPEYLHSITIKAETLMTRRTMVLFQVTRFQGSFWVFICVDQVNGES